MEEYILMIFLSAVPFSLFVLLLIAFRVGKSDSKVERFLLEKKLTAYKTIIFNIADAMHNLGSAPLTEESDINKVFLSPEDAAKLRSLFRILRNFANKDIESSADPLPYNSIIALIQNIAQNDIDSILSDEDLLHLERASWLYNFEKIEEITKGIIDEKRLASSRDS